MNPSGMLAAGILFGVVLTRIFDIWSMEKYWRERILQEAQIARKKFEKSMEAVKRAGNHGAETPFSNQVRARLIAKKEVERIIAGGKL